MFHDIIKGIHIIWMRLFDHRSFLNGEIQFSLRELEEKRNDQEVEKLFSIVEDIADIKDTQITKTKQSIDEIFPKINVDLNECLHMCKLIEDLETKYKSDISLEINRENRKVEWQLFVDNIISNCSQIDNTFEEKEVELKEFYQDLERKLFTTN